MGFCWGEVPVRLGLASKHQKGGPLPNSNSTNTFPHYPLAIMQLLCILINVSIRYR